MVEQLKHFYMIHSHGCQFWVDQKQKNMIWNRCLYALKIWQFVLGVLWSGIAKLTEKITNWSLVNSLKNHRKIGDHRYHAILGFWFFMMRKFTKDHRIWDVLMYRSWLLVGGIPTPGIPTPLKNMLKSVGMVIPNIWKNKSHVPNHQPVVLYAYVYKKLIHWPEIRLFWEWFLLLIIIPVSSHQWLFQDPKLEVPTIYKAYF